MDKLLTVAHWEEKLQERDYDPQCQRCKIKVYKTLIKHAKKIKSQQEEIDVLKEVIKQQEKVIALYLKKLCKFPIIQLKQEGSK